MSVREEPSSRSIPSSTILIITCHMTRERNDSGFYQRLSPSSQNFQNFELGQNPLGVPSPNTIGKGSREGRRVLAGFKTFPAQLQLPSMCV